MNWRYEMLRKRVASAPALAVNWHRSGGDSTPTTPPMRKRAGVKVIDGRHESYIVEEGI